MTLAYFLNTYPITSTTFVRREIEAHERAGHPIARFAIRRWDQALVDPRDIAEIDRVTYMLDEGALALGFRLLRELLRNPRGMARALRAFTHLVGAAKGNRPKQLVYLLEAVRLKQETTALGITHIHTHFSSNSATVTLLSHLLGGPSYSVTIHGPDELEVMAENALTLKTEYAAFIAAITDYCFGVVDRHTGQLFSNKIKVVRCGLDLRDFTDHTPVPDTKDLVCVGRLCDAKAQDRLVEAMAPVVAKHPDVRLTLIGDGDLRPAIEARIADLGLGDHIRLVGWKQNAEVQETILASRALLLPSLAEGLPIVLMEAFALHRPVVTTTITGIPELVDETCGWRVPPGEVESLSAALDDLLSRSVDDLTAMAAEGRARVERLHDQDKNAAHLRGLFPTGQP